MVAPLVLNERPKYRDKIKTQSALDVNRKMYIFIFGYSAVMDLEKNSIGTQL